MKEQDMINKILEQTENIPIPDSISPENMKKMLDEELSWDKNTANAGDKTTSHTRNIRRYTAVACALLCLIGGMTAYSFISHRDIDTATDMAIVSQETAYDCDDAALIDDMAENAVKGETEDAGGQEDTLCYNTNLQSPSSYNEYYKTLKTAYDEYYDSFAMVQTNGIAAKEFEDRLVGAAADGAETNSVAIPETSDEAFSMEDANYDGATDLRSQKQELSEKDHSTTNTQERDIDEGDIIKTDGEYIYRLTLDYNTLTCKYSYKVFTTKAENGKMEIVSKIDVTDLMSGKSVRETNWYFDDMYVRDDTLILLYHNMPQYTDKEYSDRECRDTTFITLVDIRDRENPKEIQTLSQSGYYKSSRISDGFLYTITDFSGSSLDTELPYSNYIPKVNDVTISCKNIYYPKEILMSHTFVITSLSLDDTADFTDEKAIPARGGDMYMSGSAIYIYGSVYGETTKTEITKVHYKDGALLPGMSATVSGYLYDTFALSEYKGYLRVVATIPANTFSLLRETDDVVIGRPDTLTEDINALYVLDSDMQLAGKIAGIAPGERIYSARFMGDIGYFVTYRNTDPLFTVDLSDPYNPTIIDELTIPGFSNYLHSYADDLLLGIGVATDPETQNFLGLKLSMFDVSNKLSVREIDKSILENADYSEAQYNRHALMIDSEKNLFGFLYFSYRNGQNDYYYVTYTYDRKKGFTETGKYWITDESAGNTGSVRGVYIGNYLYISTDNSMVSYELGGKQQIARVEFR